MSDQASKTDRELFHQPRGEATVYLARPDGEWKRHSLGGYPALNADGMPVPFLTYDAAVYGEPRPFTPEPPHRAEPGWLYRELGPCADQGDWAASGNQWFADPPDDPEHCAAMLAISEVRWLYRMLGNVSACEEGRGMMALGLAKGLVGIGHRIGTAFHDEEGRMEFYLSWQLGRMLAGVIASDDGTWAYDENPDEWLERWRSGRAEKAGGQS